MTGFSEKLKTNSPDEQLGAAYDTITDFLRRHSYQGGPKDYARHVLPDGDASYAAFPGNDLMPERCGVKAGKEKEPTIRWATNNRESAQAIRDLLSYHFDCPAEVRKKEEDGKEWAEVRIGRETAVHVVNVIRQFEAAVPFFKGMNVQLKALSEKPDALSALLDEDARNKNLTTPPEFITVLPQKKSVFAIARFPSEKAAKDWQKIIKEEFGLKAHYREARFSESGHKHSLMLTTRDIAQYLPAQENAAAVGGRG